MKATSNDLAVFNAKLAEQNARDTRNGVPLTPLRGSTQEPSHQTPGVVVVKGSLRSGTPKR